MTVRDIINKSNLKGNQMIVVADVLTGQIISRPRYGCMFPTKDIDKEVSTIGIKNEIDGNGNLVTTMFIYV